MKKFKIFLISFTLLLFTGCGNNVREVRTLDNFTDILTEKELVVSDNMSNYTVDYIAGAMIGTYDDLSIEMVIYDNEDNAINVQDSQIKSFMNMKNTNSIINKDKGKNYYKITMITNGYYLVSSRIENTLIFTKTLLKNKDTVDYILNKMEY